MGIYFDSNGERYTQNQVDARVSKAKQDKLEQMRDEHGYIFCEDCSVSSGVYFDCSHNVSVQDAKNERRVELAWDIDNIKIRCRRCHQVYDGLNIAKNG